MKTLKQMIINEIELQQKGFLDELSKISGYSSGSNLSKVLRDEKKEFDKFNGLINLVKHIFKNDEVKVMVQYAVEIDPNKKTARNMLEYLASKREFVAFNELLEKMENCTNKESQSWASVYKLQYQYEISSTTEEYDELITTIVNTRVNTFELKVYKRLLLNYCYNQKQNYVMTKSLAEAIDKDLELIENEYIKKMYTVRVNEVMSYNYLLAFNNPEKAIECADKVIEMDAEKAYIAYAYFIKGYAYLFTSYEKSIKYLNISMNLYKELNRDYDVNEVKEKIEFVNVYWGKQNEECGYLKNKLLHNIKNDNLEDNLSNEKDNMEEPFYLLLEGMNEKNTKKLILSVLKYIKQNNIFLANLAKIELIRIGYDEEILEEMISLNMA